MDKPLTLYKVYNTILEMRICFFITLISLFTSCSANFSAGDISSLVENRSAAFLVDSSEEHSLYSGYGSSCAHPGAHVSFAGDGVERNIYAIADGIVSNIDVCETAGDHNKYNITLSLGLSGAVPVYFDYSIEPFDGKLCDGNEDYFKSSILVEEGDEVKRGEKIATITPGASSNGSAHIHFALSADGATICPDIFPDSIFDVNIIGTVREAACTEGENSFCLDLTRSERPSNLID
jgi:hypothetical protein